MYIFSSRQCADYAHMSYLRVQVLGEARVARVMFAVGEAVWCL